MTLKNLLIVLILVQCFVCVGAYANDGCVRRWSEIGDYNISADGEKIIFVNQDEYCIGVIDKNGQRSIRFDDIATIKDIKPNIDVDISYDSKFLSVQFDSGESTHVVKIISTDNLSLVGEEIATSALWASDSNILILTPNYGIDEIQKTPGIYLLYPESYKTIIIAKKFYFTGAMRTGGNIIAAEVFEYKENEISSSIVVYDFKKNKQIF